VATITLPAIDATAKSLYPLAEQKARGWREDAKLVSCNATWSQTTIGLLERPVKWSYRFYSAQAESLYFVTVTPDGQVAGTQHLRRVNQSPPLLSVESWEMDSPVALASWLNYGGVDFLGSNPGVDVTAQISVRSADADPGWTVVGLKSGSNEFFTAKIDAITGQTAIVR
jgi:hypothetical protein